MMYSRDIVGLIRIPNIAKNNDYAMWLYVSKKADCYLLPDKLAKYRKRQGSISNRSKFTLIKWHYRLFKTVENCNRISAAILTFNNLVWGCLKKVLYVRHKS